MPDLLETINNMRHASGQRVMNPILAAALQANTHVAVDGQNERAAQEQSAADEKTTFMIKGGKASVKNFPVEDFIKTAEESGSKKHEEVAQLLQPASESVKMQDLLTSYGINAPESIDKGLVDPGATKWKRGYRAGRDMGMNPVAAAIRGIKTSAMPAQDPNDPQSDVRTIETSRNLQKARLINKDLLPILRETGTESRAQQSHQVALENEFERFTKAENIRSYPSARAAVTAGKREFGDNWTDDREAATRQAWNEATSKVESGKIADRRKMIRESIKPEAVGFAPDDESFINNLEDDQNPFSGGDRAYAKSLFAGAKKTWDEARGQKKMQLAQEGARLQLDQARLAHEKLTFQAAAFMSNPKTKDAFMDSIAADGNAYYDPNVQKNQYTKAAVDGEAMARFGRVPNKLEKSDHDALNAARLGNANLDYTDAIFDKWEKRGSPMTGALLGRFETWTAKFGDYRALALAGVPAKYRAEMAGDITNARTHLLNLAVTEARVATGGGRTAAQIIEEFKQTSPSLFQDGPLRKGASSGVRQVLVTRANSAYTSQWGPDGPARMLDDGRLAIWDPKQDKDQKKANTSQASGAWVVMGSR
jgi:hypothetical protein